MWLLLLGCGPSPLPPPVRQDDTGLPDPTAPPPPPAATCGDAAPDGARICLSEVQSDNDATLPAGPGAFPDWVELANLGGVAVDPERLGLVVGDAPALALSGPPLGPGEVGLWRLARGGGEGHLDAAISDQGERLELLLDGRSVEVWDVPALLGDTVLAREPSSGARVVGCEASPGRPNPPLTPCADPREALYAPGSIVDLWLTVGPEGREILQGSQLLAHYPEVPARLGFPAAEGAGEFPAVGVSLKGGYGSFRNDLSWQKPSLKIDLDAFEPRRWRGLRKLQLNNAVQDQTFARETLTYSLFRALGIPAPRVAHARVWMDDEYFGMYTQVEPVDRDFLESWFGDGSGHLLEAAYGPDFDPGDEAWFEYDQGPDEAAGRALVAEVSGLLSTQPRDEATYATLRTLVDMDGWMANMAVEAAVWHWDGYWTENNYYLYENPSTGLLHLLPHGTDQTWTDGWPQPWEPNERSALYDFCLAVPSCAELYRQQLLRVADAVDALNLEPELDRLLLLTEPEWDADPRIESRCCREELAERTRQRIRTVSDQLRAAAGPG